MADVVRKLYLTTILSVFAISALLFASFAPNIFALTSSEEEKLADSIQISMIRNSPSNFGIRALNEHVDIQLQLLVDISPSVDNDEFILQRDGYVAAFQSADVKNSIVAHDTLGDCIAVEFIYWSGPSQQTVVGDGWYKLCTATDSDNFAALIAGFGRPAGSTTAPGSAIAYGYPLFSDGQFTSTTKIIDVSGDGAQNSGADTATAVSNALGVGGINHINGISIGNDPAVIPFYVAQFSPPIGSFVPKHAATYTDFEPAIIEKILLETCTDCTPPPPTTSVGGESLSINMTSLFVTGFISNAFWIAPVAAGIAGTGLYLARSKIK